MHKTELMLEMYREALFPLVYTLLHRKPPDKNVLETSLPKILLVIITITTKKRY